MWKIAVINPNKHEWVRDGPETMDGSNWLSKVNKSDTHYSKKQRANGWQSHTARTEQNATQMRYWLHLTWKCQILTNVVISGESSRIHNVVVIHDKCTFLTWNSFPPSFSLDMSPAKKKRGGGEKWHRAEAANHLISLPTECPKSQSSRWNWLIHFSILNGKNSLLFFLLCQFIAPGCWDSPEQSKV